MKTQVEKFLEQPDHIKLFAQERLILDVTESICEVMEETTYGEDVAEKIANLVYGIVPTVRSPNHDTVKAFKKELAQSIDELVKFCVND